MLTFEHFLDAKREWRWHLKSPNGRLIASAGEGFTRKGDSVRSARRMVTAIGDGANHDIKAIPVGRKPKRRRR